MSKKEANSTNMELFQKFIRQIRTSFLLICIFFLLITSAALAQSGARAGVFEDLEIRPGVLVEVPVEIRDVTDLYAFDIEMSFDPEYLEFDDADPNKDGIQPGFGTFLDPGMTLFNLIDPEEGLIHVVMSQINPSEPKSGSGNLLVLYLTGLKTGQTTLEVTKVELSTRYGEAIPVSGVDAEIEIVTDAPVVTATPIPVIDPIEITEIPTLDPSKIPPTPTPVPSTTPVPTRTATAQVTQTRTATNTSQPVATRTNAPAATATRTNAPAATATSALISTATLVPTVAQSQATQASAEPASTLESEGEEPPAAEPTGASPAQNTLAAPVQQPNTEAEGDGSEEKNNTEGRILTKDSPQGFSNLLAWLIGAAVLLIIAVGIYFGKRKNRTISEEDK